MRHAGYSGTPLIQKLGIKTGMRVLLINPPDNYDELLGVNIAQQVCRKNEIADLVHLFVKTMREFDTVMKRISALSRKNTSLIIWVSWIKKAAKIPTDVTEDLIRDYALQHDLVDVKVCAVSEIWSGLKLVVPLSKR